MTLDWLIVGGGIHGVHHAVRLLGAAGVTPDALRILDPNPALLRRWQTSTDVTGMTYLRSPSVHHLGLEPLALQHFAGRRKRRRPGLFTAPYARPALELFNDHCAHLLKQYALHDLHLPHRAVAGAVHDDRVDIQIDDGSLISARHVVLALGTSDELAWPAWAPLDDERVGHVFAPEFDGWPSAPETVVVVGGGITAGHVALRLVKGGHTVHLVARHALRPHDFDSDPGWLGPKHMTRYQRQRDLTKRRAMITAARHRGSVTPVMHRAIRRAIARETMAWHESDVEAIHGVNETREVTLADGT